MNKEEVYKKLISGGIVSRYVLSKEGQVTVDKSFDDFFNKVGSDENLFITGLNSLYECHLNAKILKRGTSGEHFDSAQIVSLENNSVLGNFKGKKENISDLLHFFHQNKEKILKMEVFSVSELSNFNKFSQILIHNDGKAMFFLFPSITISWCLETLRAIDLLDE
ncbi:MAG TPA: hypothetical protein EYG89_06445 [Bacteroidia bacterium]|nr:hypothetical protein [Bacteroidia bacterium]